ncbi:MAG: SAM-dependent DNA methyltransferase [Candidatus Cloacimonadota bacterium]|nr:SAM-dependent DNA methyltransferase [Candidatus Cloacimonadota bacterium]
MNEQVKSKKRIADHGEVFTAERQVNAMLDLVKQETERIDSRFLEPACGIGNFLIEILDRKLSVVEQRYKRNQIEFEKYSILAISSIYGIDILQDNIIECRDRLYNLFVEKYKKLFKTKTKTLCEKSARFILEKNIIHGDALTLCKVNTDEPIVFSEWAIISNNLLKRRDFTMDELLNKKLPEYKEEEIPLFTDENDPAFLPQPFKVYPPIHFLRIGENAE